VAPDVTSAGQQNAALAVRRVLATWNDIEDLVSIGAYVPGTNLEYDLVLQTRDAVNAFLTQGRDDGAALTDSVARLCALGTLLDDRRAALAARTAGAVAPVDKRRGASLAKKSAS
jgi:flagellar biosynthesis/type III secretory pathway ATPase